MCKRKLKDVGNIIHHISVHIRKDNAAASACIARLAFLVHESTYRSDHVSNTAVPFHITPQGWTQRELQHLEELISMNIRTHTACCGLQVKTDLFAPEQPVLVLTNMLRSKYAGDVYVVQQIARIHVALNESR